MDSEATWTLLCSSFKAQWMPCEKSLSGPALWFLDFCQEDPQEVFFFGHAWAASQKKSKKQGLSWRATARPRLGTDFRGWFYRGRYIQIPNLGTGWNCETRDESVPMMRRSEKSCMFIIVYPLQDLTVVGTKTPSKKKWCLGMFRNMSKRMVKIKPNRAEAPTGCPQGVMRQWTSRRSSASCQERPDVGLTWQQLRVTCQYESTRRPGPGRKEIGIW